MSESECAANAIYGFRKPKSKYIWPEFDGATTIQRHRRLEEYLSRRGSVLAAGTGIGYRSTRFLSTDPADNAWIMKASG